MATTSDTTIRSLKQRYNEACFAYNRAWNDLYPSYAGHPLVQPSPLMKDVRRDASWTDEQLRNAIPHDLALESRFHASVLVIALDYGINAAMTFKLSSGNIDPRKAGEA